MSKRYSLAGHTASKPEKLGNETILAALQQELIRLASSKRSQSALQFGRQSLLGVRKVVRRRHAGFVSLFQSRRFGAMEAESGLEYDFLVVNECDREIRAVISQPVELEWRDRTGRLRKHIPDYALLRGDDCVLAEVKPASRAVSADIAERTAAFEEMLPSYGFEYELHNEARIREEPRFSRSRALITGLGYRPSLEDITGVIRSISESKSALTPNGIIKHMSKEQDFIYYIYAMTIDGYLSVLTEPGPMRFASSNKTGV